MRSKKNLDFPKNQIFQDRAMVCENMAGYGQSAAMFETVPRSFFITATDTDVGKTYTAAQIVKALKGKIGYFKPFQSGIEDGVLTDADVIKNARKDVIIKNSYITKTPASPALSAKIDGMEISLSRVMEDYKTLCEQCDHTIVEGSGGLLVPVTDELLMSDVVLALDLPILIITRPDLGTINHTLLTIREAERLNIKVLGVVMTHPPELFNEKYIEKFSGYRVQSLEEFIQTLSRLFQDGQ